MIAVAYCHSFFPGKDENGDRRYRHWDTAEYRSWRIRRVPPRHTGRGCGLRNSLPRSPSKKPKSLPATLESSPPSAHRRHQDVERALYALTEASHTSTSLVVRSRMLSYSFPSAITTLMDSPRPRGQVKRGPKPLNASVRRQMKRMPRSGSKPEMALRKELFHRGLRFVWDVLPVAVF